MTPLLVLLGCAPCLLERSNRSCEDWPPVTETAETGDSGDTAAPVRVRSEDAGDGVTETWVDATAYLDWVYLSFATAAEAFPADPADSTEWDLGFQRYLVMSNGGVSGTGGVEAVVVEGLGFEEIAQAPAEGWGQDLPDDEDENQNPEYALGDWFDYAEEDHTVTPKDLVYAIRAVGGSYYKLQFMAYYDEAGSPAYFTLRWASVLAP